MKQPPSPPSPSSPALPYARQSVSSADRAAVAKVLQSPYLTQGPSVERFERALCEYTGASYAVAFANASAALHAGLWAAGMRRGRAAVVSPISFCSTANSVLHCGGEVFFTDIDASSVCLSPSALSEGLRLLASRSVRVGAVVAVHMGGVAAHSAEIRQKLSGMGECKIIEDASHALGGCYEDGQRIGCGAYADVSVFSFHPIKPITSAEGGMAVTQDAEMARAMRMFRNHGIERSEDRFVGEAALDSSRGLTHYEQQALGFNYRLSDVHAALGLSQMSRLEELRDRRRRLSEHYDQALSSDDLGGCVRALQGRWRGFSAHHLYLVAVDWQAFGLPRREVMRGLSEMGIGTQVHYIPIPDHPYYRTQRPRFEFPLCQSSAYAKSTLSLPLYADMRVQDVERVISGLRQLRQSAPSAKSRTCA